jgi:hypothetical protein
VCAAGFGGVGCAAQAAPLAFAGVDLLAALQAAATPTPAPSPAPSPSHSPSPSPATPIVIGSQTQVAALAPSAWAFFDIVVLNASGGSEGVAFTGGLGIRLTLTRTTGTGDPDYYVALNAFPTLR